MPSISLESIRGCPDCGLLTEMPESQNGVDIDCPRCDSMLSRRRRYSMKRALAYSVAGFFFCLALMTSPFLDVVLYGRQQTSTLWLGPDILDQEGLWPVAIVVLLMTLLLPTLKLALNIIVLVSLKFEHPSPVIVTLFRWVKHISPWAMLEVYLLGLLVAYTRLEAMSAIKIDTAVYALVGAMLSMTAADFLLDREQVWSVMREKGLGKDLGDDAPFPLLSCHLCHQVSRQPLGSHCPRCGTKLHFRKKDSIARAWAYMLTAAIFYIPANILPVMVVTSVGRPYAYTIAGGMIELAEHRLLPLAILVFIASIAIPFLKMLSLAYLLITMHKGAPRHLERRTTLYRVIDFIGRWSMVDIFMISILVALMHFGQLAQIKAEGGAIYFAAVVIFTMLAVESFDPRLMWDKAGRNDKLLKETAYG